MKTISDKFHEWFNKYVLVNEPTYEAAFRTGYNVAMKELEDSIKVYICEKQRIVNENCKLKGKLDEIALLVNEIQQWEAEKLFKKLREGKQ